MRVFNIQLIVLNLFMIDLLLRPSQMKALLYPTKEL